MVIGEGYPVWSVWIKWSASGMLTTRRMLTGPFKWYLMHLCVWIFEKKASPRNRTNGKMKRWENRFILNDSKTLDEKSAQENAHARRATRNKMKWGERKRGKKTCRNRKNTVNKRVNKWMGNKRCLYGSIQMCALLTLHVSQHIDRLVRLQSVRLLRFFIAIFAFHLIVMSITDNGMAEKIYFRYKSLHWFTCQMIKCNN